MCARAMGFGAGHNTANLPLCCGRWHPGMTLLPLTHPTGHPLFRVCQNCVVFLFSFLLTTIKLMKPMEIASNERKVHQTPIQHRVALSLSFHTQLVPNSPRNQRLSPSQSPSPPSTAQPCFPQPSPRLSPLLTPFSPSFLPPSPKPGRLPLAGLKTPKTRGRLLATNISYLQAFWGRSIP